MRDSDVGKVEDIELGVETETEGNSATKGASECGRDE